MKLMQDDRMKELVNELYSCEFTRDQHRDLVAAVNCINRELREKERRTVARTFSRGDRVKFTNSRTGETVTGMFLRTMRTNCEMRDERTGRTWRVSPGLLEQA